MLSGLRLAKRVDSGRFPSLGLRVGPGRFPLLSNVYPWGTFGLHQTKRASKRKGPFHRGSVFSENYLPLREKQKNSLRPSRRRGDTRKCSRLEKSH